MDKKGITLIALVVTIVVLIILATISINSVFGENGFIKRAEASKHLQEISKARESLSLTLTNAGGEKRVNKTYDQDEFLDNFILEELPNIKLRGDIVIVDNNAFEIDRNVPEIAKYVGKEYELTFPEVQVSTVIAEDNRTATIAISAKETEVGIKKIEIIQNGDVIKEYSYDNVKEAINEKFTTRQNGKYTIKVYAKLVTTEKTEVKGLIAMARYSPSGNEKYQKEHQVKLSVVEKPENVKSIKYQWLNTTVEPSTETFTESCNNNATITGKGYTGTYYLWTLLETEDNKTNIGRSEAFNFDNEGPTVELTSTTVSETSFTLTATASDNYSEIAKYDFYIGETQVNTQTTTSGTATYTYNGTKMEKNKECYVIVTDELGNVSEKRKTLASTKLHTWESWTYEVPGEYSLVCIEPDVRETFDRTYQPTCYESITCDKSTGNLTYGKEVSYNWSTMYGWYISGKYVCKIGNRTSSDTTWGKYHVAKYEVQKVEKDPVKMVKTGTETSASKQYPDDGISGDRWYIYLGIY